MTKRVARRFTSRITIDLSEVMREDIRKLAERDQTTEASVIRLALAQFIRSQSKGK